MKLQTPITLLFEQLGHSVEKLTDEQYCFPAAVLSQATIGQHLRHIIEFFLELNKGYETGSVNYDKRQRDHRIETDRLFAIQKLHEVLDGLPRPDKNLTLVASLTPENNSQHEFKTNYNRELLYNLEHTVHHMAFIRTGIEAVSVIQLPVQFGVAESTLQSRKVCAQ
jgi:hypothetical protein